MLAGLAKPGQPQLVPWPPLHHTVNSTVHTTNRATPTQLVFNRDAMLNISFEADWQCIKEQKQHRILQNNTAENAKHKGRTHHPGDEAMVEADPSRELEGQRLTWNICKLRPC